MLRKLAATSILLAPLLAFGQAMAMVMAMATGTAGMRPRSTAATSCWPSRCWAAS